MRLLAVAHIIIAILASWRITELFTQDRITDRLRKRFPTYLWQCPRCMSVWAGMWAAGIFMLGLRWPLLMFLNWIFGLAWIYLTHLDWTVGKRMTQRGRELKFTLDAQGNFVTRSELTPQEMLLVVSNVHHQLMTQMGQPAPSQPIPTAIPISRPTSDA